MEQDAETASEVCYQTASEVRFFCNHEELWLLVGTSRWKSII